MATRGAPGLMLLLALCATLLGQAPEPPRPAAAVAAPDTTPKVATSPATGGDPRISLRVAAGEEWDSNARRAVSASARVVGAALPSGDVVGDALTRFLADVEGDVPIARAHALHLGYVLGAKHFYRYGSEDLVVHELSAATTHALTDRLSLETWGTARASRIRSAVRDYSLGTLGAGARFRPIPELALAANAGLIAFDFKPEERFSYAGPSAGGEVSFLPIRRLELTARGDYTLRIYRGQALVPGTTTDAQGQTVTVVTFCDGKGDQLRPPACTPVARQDGELALLARAAYRGAVIASIEYLYRRQRSTSDLEDVDRHRVSAAATVPLPLEITANLLAALQINAGAAATQALYLAEDDENQNSLELQLSRAIQDGLVLEVRYALFANQFTTAPVSFFRQTIYVGLSYRIGS